MTPVDVGNNFPLTGPLAQVAWVYDYALEIEPVMRKNRFDGAFRHLPEAAVIAP